MTHEGINRMGAKVDARRIRALRTQLLAHYDEHRRALPWRRGVDPYGVWVSEIMLQQTRVETVIPYYERWMARFSTIGGLARATQGEVLKHWEGLGYYSRARNLHKGAKVVLERFDGALPSTESELRSIPGVGEYTAGALASIAFGEPVPAVDGNVRRVLARLFDEPVPSRGFLRERARRLVDPDRAGDFNQALMELGATVCTPRVPRCDSCPWASQCEARAQGTTRDRPRPKSRRPLPEITHRVTVLLCAGADRAGTGLSEISVLLQRRPEDGLLGGLWECPTAVTDGGERLDAHSHLRSAVAEIAEGDPSSLPAVLHTYSHFKAEYRPCVMMVKERVPVPGMKWFSADEAAHVALPVAQRKILDSAFARAMDGS